MSAMDRNDYNYPFRSMTDFGDELYRPVTGRELEAVPLGLGPTPDVTVVDGRVYAITSDSLVILDGESLEILGRLEGLLSTRQVAVCGTVAVVTAREAGVYVVDVSDATAPRLASHYDPVEFATGVHLARPDLAILTCRHYGLEFVDLTRPEAPRFHSSILIGEAQSVTSRGTIAYAGAWFEKELVLVDFADPSAPRIVGRSALDGFGDGVHVRQDLAYVATGHHSRLQRAARTFERARHITLDMFENGYGVGHGVEIHDVSDPTHPRCINRVKSPPGFCSPDTWRVICHDNLLIQADSGSGVFVYDLSDPAAPTPLAFAVLPPYETYRKPRTVSIQDDRHPVTGVAVAGKTLLLAGKTSDLYRCSLPSPADPRSRGDRPKSTFPSQYPDPDTPQRSETENLLETTEQVHWVSTDGEVLFAAAGEDGVYILDPGTRRVIGHHRTSGPAQHVCCSRGLIYVSEVTNGLSVWERNGTSLHQVGSWAPGSCVRQVTVPEGLHRGLAIAGDAEFVTIDLSDPANPVGVARFRPVGLAYARTLADDIVDDRYALGGTQGAGLNWFDLSEESAIGDPPKSSGDRLCSIAEGFTVHDGRALVVQAGGYFFASADHVRPHGDMEHIREPNRFFSGVPRSIRADRLVITNRATGSARILDVSDALKPVTLAYLHLPGHPDRPIRVGDHLVFPCGRAGLRAVPCP